MLINLMKMQNANGSQKSWILTRRLLGPKLIGLHFTLLCAKFLPIQQHIHNIAFPVKLPFVK